MIHGTHILFYSTSPAVDREFFRDVLGFRSVDAGQGWLIFAMPPAEAAFHPLEDNLAETPSTAHNMLGAHVYLMCSDLESVLETLTARNVTHTPVEDAPWGVKTTFRLPSGGEIGLYQPKHRTAIDLS